MITTPHEFGGDWTTEKLDCLKEYLSAYTKIFRVNPRAQYFITTYVDAFAGTGYRIPSRSHQAASLPLLGIDEDQEAETYLKGSARIALEVDPPFHHYLFIDTNPLHVQELERLRQDFPGRKASIQIEQANANNFLIDWCQQVDWRRNRAVVFLDPYGMQVNWETIQIIAATKAIDLWLLFPLGVSINRLLTQGKPPPSEWAQALTRIFGTDEWQSAFYSREKVLKLWGEEDQLIKNVGFEQIGRFFVKRLHEVFYAVIENPLPLYNSKNSQIYLLCFAAGNPKGSTAAMRIADSIIKKHTRK
jgi:three-Cys-motif partner protein